MSESIVADILERIRKLSDEDRRLLEARLAELAEAEWRQEAEGARRAAREQCLDQGAIDRAIDEVRYGP
jgi:hypothetical protein